MIVHRPGAKVYQQTKNSERAQSVAVIIPAYNASEYLDQTLASLVTQTRSADEVVVYDDGSDDNTFETAKRWVEVLPLRVLRATVRSGAWHARNEAIRHTDSALIAQLDADDILLPHHLSSLVTAYNAQPGLVAPRRLLWEFPATTTFSIFPEKIPDTQDQLSQLLLQNYVSAGALYPRSIFDRVGGYRPIPYGQDWDLWIRMAGVGVRISKPAIPTYVYRMHPNNISSRVHRDETDIEILQRFLASAEEPKLRFVAKISMLQRMGAKFVLQQGKILPRYSLRELCAPNECELPPDAVFSVLDDPDLGRVAIGSSPSVSGKLCVFSRQRTLLLAGHAGEDGFEVDCVPPGLEWSRRAMLAERIARYRSSTG